MSSGPRFGLIHENEEANKKRRRKGERCIEERKEYCKGKGGQGHGKRKKNKRKQKV